MNKPGQPPRKRALQLMRSSTRQFFRTGRAAGKSWADLVHGYAYARWPYGYIGSALAEKKSLAWMRVLFAPFLVRALFPLSWADEYHGKVMPTAQAVRLVMVDEDLSLPQPENVIPFTSARDLILSHEQSIAVLDCPCRMAREKPCLPLDVCLIVGEPFVSFVLEHHPQHARAVKPEEALAIMEAEADRGHVQHAFFKRAMLGRFYAICNCCSCCCGAMQAQRNGTPMLIASGWVSKVDEARCRACGRCAEICPFGAISIDRISVVNRDACMGCGVCTRVCEHDALSLELDSTKPTPLLLEAQQPV